MNKEYLDKLEWVEKIAKTLGASGIKSVIGVYTSIEMAQRDEQLESLKESVESSLSVELFVDGKYSTHNTNDLRPEILEKFLKNAVEMTRYLSKDDYRTLPDPKYYAGQKSTDLQLVDPAVMEMTIEKKKKLIKETVDAAKKLDDRIISVTSSFWNGQSYVARRHSNGFTGEYESTNIGLGAEITIQDPNGKKPEGWKFIGVRHKTDMWSPEMIAKQAVARTKMKIGAEKIPSQKMTMLVENNAMGRFFWPVLGALNGRNLQQNQSFLKDKINTKIGSELLTVTDNPFILRGMGSQLFDSEGLAVKERPIVEKGVLKTYFIDTYYGKKLGIEPTSGGTTNVTFKLGNRSLEEMAAQIEKGIWVTAFIGGNSNGTTGDFSYGVMGLLIENGKIIKPVSEMNISGNYLDMLNQIKELGNDENVYSGLRTPSIRFDNVDFAGL